MKVVIAAGGRFHALHLAHQLEKKNYLEKLFTFGYTTRDKEYLPAKFVCEHKQGKLLDSFFLKLKLYKFFNKSNFNVIKDNIFDSWLSKNLKTIKEIDIFVGWANYFLKSLPEIRKTGAKIIVECGSTHILEQQRLILEEYEKFGLKSVALPKQNIDKVLEEYKQSDYIMTCSNFTYRSFIKHGIRSGKILKVPYGVNLDFFTDRFQNFKKNDGKFRVICVGLMCLRKGIPYLIEAWEKLNLPEKESELLLVGNLQNDLKHVLKKIQLPKNVIFFGSVGREKLAKLYNQSSVFVLPSIEEGLSMTIAEAMSCALPVICTNNTGGEELIDDNKHGFIVGIRDIDALIEKILWCFNNKTDAKKMGLKGQSKIKNFTWDHYGKKIIKTYQSIL
ncbi:glycosyltransferase [Candidatus Dependentiae bacterium]|nr:glycosyltransferase [Candidatus Dependentiae bacterium]